MSVTWTVAAITLLFAPGTVRAATIRKIDRVNTTITLAQQRTDLCGRPIAVAAAANGAYVFVLTLRGWIYRLSSTDLSSGGTPPQACSTDQPQTRLPDPSGGGSRPNAIALAVNPSTNEVYVGLADGRIYRYPASLGNTFASSQSVANPVVALTIDSSNNVYVAYGSKIDKWDSSLSSKLFSHTLTATVKAIKAVATGDVYVATSDSTIHLFNSSLTELTGPGTLQPTSTCPTVTVPLDIASSGGTVIVRTSNALYKVGPTAVVACKSQALVAVDVDSVGDVVAADSGGTVFVFDTMLSSPPSSISTGISQTRLIAAKALTSSSASFYVVGGSDGASEGDPHFTTIDGVRYDFQSAGEFVLLRHTGSSKVQVNGADVSGPTLSYDAMEIQVRQFPVATTANTCVSLNSAVAARVGKHRVTYEPNLSGQPDPSGLQLRIDGKLITLDPSGSRFGDGGRIVATSTPGGLEIDFPDDSILFITPGWWGSQGKWYLNLNVVPQQSALGLAGNVPEGSWLPTLPDGTSMGPAPGSAHDRYVALYERFADAWRVTDATTLFDYAPGTSTKTFTMRDWPPESGPCDIRGTVPVEGVTEEVAKEACQRVPGDPANCIFDVKITGLLSFANTYVASRNVQPVPEAKPKRRHAGTARVAVLTFLGLLALWMVLRMRRGKGSVLR